MASAIGLRQVLPVQTIKRLCGMRNGPKDVKQAVMIVRTLLRGHGHSGVARNLRVVRDGDLEVNVPARR